MTESSDKPARRRTSSVSMTKRPRTRDAAAAPSDGSRPREARLAVIALITSAIATLIASLSLFGLDSWLRVQLTKSYAKAHKNAVISAHDLATEVHNAKLGAAQQSVIAVLAIGFVAYGIYRGKYWARWGTVGVWGLGTFSGLVFGVFSILAIAADAPLAYKGFAFIAAVAMAAAVVLVNLRPSVVYFGLGRPVPGARGGRRGLFGPRPSPPLRGAAAARPAKGTAAAAGADDDPAGPITERSPSKKRAETAAVAKGAELARSRAKASKSRRRADV